LERIILFLRGTDDEEGRFRIASDGIREKIISFFGDAFMPVKTQYHQWVFSGMMLSENICS